MEKNKNFRRTKSNTGRVWIGVIIILIGVSMLTKTLGLLFFFPGWLFSWPMWLIIIGIFIGANNNFRKPSSIILIAIGFFFLLQRVVDVDLGRFFWPLFIIMLGFWLISGRRSAGFFDWPGDPKKQKYRPAPPDDNAAAFDSDLDWDRRVIDQKDTDTTDSNPLSSPNADADGHIHVTSNFKTDKQNGPEERDDSEDYIDSVSIFGQVKKNVITKNFRGGDIVNIMGGADVNLMKADIKNVAILEVVQIFGGTNIIVPAHWKVTPEMTAIFGGIEDKRDIYGINTDESKILIIRGSSIFGGITIKTR